MEALRSLLAKFALIAVLSRREQLLVFFAVIAVIVVGFNQLLIEPQLKTISAVQSQIAGHKTGLETLQKSLVANKQSNAQEVEQLTLERDSLLGKVEQANQILAQAAQSNKIPDLMRRMISRNSEVKIVSIKSLPPSVYVGEKTPTSGSDGALYQHGVEISLQGTYPQIVDYLNKIGQREPGLFWANLELQVNEYPKSTARLVVHTLSNSKEIGFE